MPVSKNRPDYISEFEIAKENSKRLRVYANGIIESAMEEMRPRDIGIGLVDKNGCLLNRYSGSDEFSSWADARGLTVRSIWLESSIGPNAIDIGLKTSLSAHSCLEKHSSEALRDAFVCFAPLHSPVTELKFETLGGLMVFGSAPPAIAEALVKEYAVVAQSVANEINIYLNYSTLVVNLLTSPMQKVFTIEESKGHLHLTTWSDNLFELFDNNATLKFYQRLDTFLDPLPDNREFWDIVREHRKVYDYDITYTVKGKQYVCATTTYFYEEQISGSITLFFVLNSMKSKTDMVARRVGNNAKITFDDILGENKKLKGIVAMAMQIAGSNRNILILGESGVGKELFAQAIHNRSPRREKPFIAINCGAIPRDLIVSELFGYENGAYTGSKKGGQIGKFELADGGTLFLDEIGDMPIDLQVVLLRAIESGSFMRLGGNSLVSVDVRIIAATNADLNELILRKVFRSDLFYRLSNFTIKIPPLRDRPEDIPLFVQHFTERVSMKIFGKSYKVSPEVLNYLSGREWKGNVRELQSYAEAMVYLYPAGDMSVSQLSEAFPNAAAEKVAPDAPDVSDANTLAATQRKKSNGPVTKEAILAALAENKYHKGKTASRLNISRATLYRLIDKFHI